MKKLFFLLLVLLSCLATAQFDMGGMMRKMKSSPIALMGIGDIKKELKLNGEQSKKIDAVHKEYTKKMQADSKGARGNDMAAGMALMNGMNEATDNASKAVVEILNPDQAKRLREIQFQITGASILYEEDTQKALVLSEEQVGKIAEWKSGEMDRMMALAQSRDSKALKKMKETEEATLLKILTPEQNAKLKEMQGKPCPAAQKLKNAGF